MADARSVTDAEIRSGFASLHEAIALGFAKMDERFSRMDERFSQMDERFGRLEQSMLRRFDGVDTRLDALEGKRRRRQ